MNNKETLSHRLSIKNLLDRSVIIKEGAICFSREGKNGKRPESLKHFYKKCEICWILKCTGHIFVTEARFTESSGGGRADILVLDSGGIAIEIWDSESETSLDAKEKTYPVRVVRVGVGEEFKEELIL